MRLAHLKAKLSSPDIQNSGSPDTKSFLALIGLISNLRIAPDHIDKPDWVDDGIPKIEFNSVLRYTDEVKTPDKIERMRETCHNAREVLDAAARIIQPGVMTDEIDRVVHEATIAAERDNSKNKIPALASEG